MSIPENLKKVLSQIPETVTLVVVTKTHALEKLMAVYHAGYKIFGENKVQELCDKQAQMPADIQWHLIGHLQSNKVKYIAPFVSLIHSVDSFKLLSEIDKQAKKNNRIIPCLLQIFIAEEETKFGLDFNEAISLLNHPELKNLKNIRISGLMGMATFTEDTAQVRKEFQSLKHFYDQQKSNKQENVKLEILSMGMSGDYLLAIEEGSNMVRVGSAILGNR